MPDVAGFPVSEEERFFVLQIHYDNPQLKEGVIDSASGVLLHFTDTPRQYDAGTSRFIWTCAPIFILRAYFQAGKWFPSSECRLDCTDVKLSSYFSGSSNWGSDCAVAGGESGEQCHVRNNVPIRMHFTTC